MDLKWDSDGDLQITSSGEYYFLSIEEIANLLREREGDEKYAIVKIV